MHPFFPPVALRCKNCEAKGLDSHLRNLPSVLLVISQKTGTSGARGAGEDLESTAGRRERIAHGADRVPVLRMVRR